VNDGIVPLYDYNLVTRGRTTQLPCTMGDVDVLKAQVVRRDTGEPWGFRLQGGSDAGQPLTIVRVRIITNQVYTAAAAA